MGGRTDGLHRRQPWATFDSEGQNSQIMVVDPLTGKMVSTGLEALPDPIQDQLRSTNMEFHQQGDLLYLVGGYGYSKMADDHLTYPYMTVVEVSGVIKAIEEGRSFSPFFRQVKDENLAVTGGALHQLNGIFYLTGGQRFDGRYNPMGGPSYVQQYTNAIRKFKVVEEGRSIHLHFLSEIKDTVQLHRRDYNVLPQILPNGAEGLTAFSGVFRYEADLPFMNCVNIDSSGYLVNNDFWQFYNQYHCAHIPVYSQKSGEMHNLFLGGIAQYYDSAGVMVQDDNVPFVSTIARVTRDRKGRMSEYKLPGRMPVYLGSSAEFIPLEQTPCYPNGVIKLDEITASSTQIGYILGGIAAPSRNIFWENDGTQSKANNQLLKVILLKGKSAEADALNTESISSLHLQVEAHLIAKEFELTFDLPEPKELKCTLEDSNRKVLIDKTFQQLLKGHNKVAIPFEAITNGASYFIIVETGSEKIIRKIIVNI